ncbi:ABC-type multidrug transport system fused ATPase/permease subunit [Microbacterium resistens]|uniref:ABC-type multidrug transport system fused ATPase/permease subunit n=1 Tax=Microbacterium resistens TaxID=156977 RepID=A0ABU1SBN0_9MICO|nr:ABC transporter ATP-binding protein [Microbacterium resistens]MDR6867020.1 ABC-type multidrug transport system fused ATPase/permease subunit [Microbacterium resistens]
MRTLPEPYVAPPVGVTPAGFLAWLVRMQWTTVLQGIVCDVVWLLGLALTPWAIGRAVDEGLVAGDYGAFLGWLGVVVWLQLQHSLIQGLRDRAGSVNYERGVSRVDQVIVHTATRITVAADRKLGSGSVVTMASNDAWWFGFVPINVGTLVSALASFITVAVLLLRDSVLLGLIVIIAVPSFSMLQVFLVGVLRSRQSVAREATREMNAVATDSVRGLRVIRGIGGEDWFLDRFRVRSDRARDAQKSVAWPVSIADALGVLISGVLVVGLTWIGAAMVARGELRVGELVAFYGYAGFLVLPVTLFNQVIRVVVRGMIAARAIVELLDVEPLWPASGAEARSVGEGPVLHDVRMGLVVHEHELLAVVVTDSQEAGALVDRLARLESDGPDAVLLHGRPMAALALRDVRDRVVVSDPVPFLFSGTLRELLDPWRAHADEEILRAVTAAAGDDILEPLEEGLDALVGERGVEFSGGQRQRLGAARALLADAPILVLHDPTSAVDAATEERMAQGIRAHRAGATTVILTTSPLVLGGADRVVVVDETGVRAEGTHEELVGRDLGYRRIVLRAEGVA